MYTSPSSLNPLYWLPAYLHSLIDSIPQDLPSLLISSINPTHHPRNPLTNKSTPFPPSLRTQTPFSERDTSGRVQERRNVSKMVRTLWYLFLDRQTLHLGGIDSSYSDMTRPSYNKQRHPPLDAEAVPLRLRKTHTSAPCHTH